MKLRITKLIPIFIILLGSWLRLRYFGDIEFKEDESLAMEMTQKLVSGEIATRGLMSSIGVSNAPLFIYLMAPVQLITNSPYLVTLYITIINISALVLGWFSYCKRFGRRIATLMLLFFATSPWAVLFSRKIWAQNLLPVLMVPFWYGLLVWAQSGVALNDKRTKKKEASWWLIFIVAVALWAPQIHMSGIILGPIIFFTWLLIRPSFSWKALLTGFLIGLLPLVPYIVFLLESNFREFQLLAHHEGSRSFDPNAVIYFFSTSAGLGFKRILGGQGINNLNNFLGLPLLSLCKAAFWIQFIMMLYALISLVKNGELAIKVPILTGVSVMAAMFLLLRVSVYQHYFIVMFPLQFLLLALGVNYLLSHFPSGWQKKAIWCLVALMILANFVYTIGIQEFIRRTGGVNGDYGVSLQHKMAIVKVASGHGNFITMQGHPLTAEYAYLEKQIRATDNKSNSEVTTARRYDINPCFKQGSCEMNGIVFRSGPLFLVEQGTENTWRWMQSSE